LPPKCPRCASRLIRREIERLAPDVLGLQEVLRYAPARDRLFEATPASCQATEIAEGLGYGVAYAEACEYGQGLKFGNALLSRFPIASAETLPLPGVETGEARALLAARVETPHGTLPVFVTHLNWKLHHGAVRFRQVKFIAARVFEREPVRGPHLPPVLMGDFNADPDADEMRFLRGLKVDGDESVFFADAWLYGGDGGPGATFALENAFAAAAHEPSRRIDYIFVRGPDSLLRGEPVRTALAFDRAESRGDQRVWPSDHYGVVSDVHFAPRSP
jgi:endonuclease/exonuclease/phosphatase family metal-dependent hydrolase